MLSRAGYGSRREIERLIEQGEVHVNGQRATLGQKITTSDKVSMRGHNIRFADKVDVVPRVLLYHKRMGEVTTRKDPEKRDTVFDHLPSVKPGRWIAIGRLDINTDGLLLFTNDGELANKLMHPSSEIEREYAVRVLGDVTDEMITTLKQGVALDDGMAKFVNIRFSGGEGANSWYHVVLKEGRNREVRRMWEAVGVQVSRLRRIRYENVALDRSLKAGKYEEMPIRQLRRLYESLDMDVPETLTTHPTKQYAKKKIGKKQAAYNDRSRSNPRPQNKRKRRS